MNSLPELLIERIIRRGWHVMRRHPAYVYECLPNLDRRSQEEVQRFVASEIIDIKLGPPSSPVALPGIVILPRGETETGAYLSNDMDFDPPEEMAFDELDQIDAVAGVASASGTAGQGPIVIDAMQASGGGGTWIEIESGGILFPSALANRGCTVGILVGAGAGQLRAVLQNAGHRIVVAPWDAGKVPDETSWFEVRGPAGDVIGEPVRQFDRARQWRRSGARYQHTIAIEEAAKTPTLTVILGYLIKGLLLRNTLELVRRGVDNLVVTIGELARKPDYFPDNALSRTLSVTCETEFAVMQPIEEPAESFELRIWAHDDDEAPIAVVSGSFLASPPVSVTIDAAVARAWGAAPVPIVAAA